MRDALHHLRPTLRPFFDSTTLDRGLDYARRGYARIVRVTNGKLGLVIEALCEGSQADPYAQRVDVIVHNGRLAQVSDTLCSCPLEGDCKHTVAALLTWLAGNVDEDEDAVPVSGHGFPVPAPSIAAVSSLTTATATAAPPVLHEPPPPGLSPELETWLVRAGALAEAPRAAASPELVHYLLDAERATLVIERARRTKDGRLSPLKPVDPNTHHFDADKAPPRYATAEDIEIIRLARHAPRARAITLDGYDPRAYCRFSIEGGLGHTLIARALATDRVHQDIRERAEAESKPRREGVLGARLVRGPARAGRFAWQSAPDGSLGLAIQTTQGLVIGLPTSPMLYADLAEGTVGELLMEGPLEHVLPLLRLPRVPRGEHAVFFPHWQRLLARAQPDLALPDAPPELGLTAPATPLIELRLSTTEFEVYGRPRTRIESLPIAEVVVRYGPDIEFELSESAPLVSHARANGGWVTIARHVDAERDAYRALLAGGLQRMQGWGYGRHRIDRAPYWTIGDGSTDRWRASIGVLVSRADAAGIAVAFEDGFPLRVSDPEDWDEDLTPVSGGGWFELEVGITVEGKRVPIAAPLARWLSLRPDPLAFLTAPGEDRHILLDLPDGGLVRLPVERVRRLLAPLFELGAPEFDPDGRIRVSRLEAALHPDLGPIVERLGAEFRAFRERIAHATDPVELDAAPGFAAELRHYQRAGLAWLQFLREAGFGGILADDMGLGKTVQTLAHLQLDKHAGRATRPSLVVAPTSVLPNWRAEAERFAPDLRVLVLHGKERRSRFREIPQADLVLTTYALLTRDAAPLTQHEYHALIIDEGQFLKNPDGRQREVAASLVASHRIVLTGTPVENNLRELWSLFDLALPGLLGGHDRFARYFRAPIERERDAERLAMLKRRIRPFLVRRRREDVLGELPPRTEIVHKVEIDGAQRDLYESLRITLDTKLRAVIAEKGIAQSQIMILDALLKLRQACCDPRLVKTPSAHKAHGASAKLEFLKETLPELQSEGRRTLVFSQFASMIALIEAELPALGLKHVKIIGDTPIEERDQAVRRFQAGEADVFLISLRAGGTGLNLTAADTVIHYDPWWNPAVEAQATARAHRIGQDKSVFVYKLIAGGTVEERILELLARKQQLADAILSGGEVQGSFITEDDIEALLAPMH